MIRGRKSISRINKKPEERKEEILNAAEELFLTEGYENTSVNTIVARVGIAKGLFYYYFKAKDEVLNAISNKYVQNLSGKIADIADNKEKSAVEKIHQIMESMISQFGLQNKGIKRLALLFNKEKNSAIHHRLAAKMVEEIKPYFTSILKQGIQEGCFKAENPDFIAETLLMWAVSLHNKGKTPITDRGETEIKARAAENMIERILGAEQGILNLFQYFEAVIDELLSF